MYYFFHLLKVLCIFVSMVLIVLLTSAKIFLIKYSCFFWFSVPNSKNPEYGASDLTALPSHLTFNLKLPVRNGASFFTLYTAFNPPLCIS